MRIIFKFNHLNTLALSGMLALNLSCGSKEPKTVTVVEEVEEEEEKKEEEQKTEDLVKKEEKQEVLQLKGTALLAQSLYSTLGPGMDLTEELNEQGQPISLFEIYGNNFGNTDGLRFGEIIADSPSTAYLMSLSILANNAARACQKQMLYGNITLCNCASDVDAKSMLARAFPHLDFSDASKATLVEDFRAHCQKNYLEAISSLIASLAFAVRS